LSLFKYDGRVAVGWYDFNDNFHFVSRATYETKNYRYINSKTVTNFTMYECKRLNLVNTTVLSNGLDVRDNIVVLVEGIFDALSVGYPARAMLGKGLKRHQIKYLLADDRINYDTEIVIFLDEGTEKDRFKIIEKLKVYFNKVSIAKCCSGKDPGDMNDQEIKFALRNRKVINE